MGIALHSMVVGQPFRMKHLRRAMEHIQRHQAQCWFATAGDIARFSETVIPRPGAGAAGMPAA
jgi:allantoinase